MTDFPRHTEDSAPEGSKELISAAVKNYGFVPGLYSVMADAPSLLNAYAAVHDQFEASSFNADELTVVWQAINVENRCHYCVPAHTAIAKGMKVDDAIINALRDETPLPSARLEALRTFALQLVRQRGELTDAEKQAFLDAGYTTQNMLEVVLGYAQKIMSNYTNHLANTVLDEAFEPFAWHKAQEAA